MLMPANVGERSSLTAIGKAPLSPRSSNAQSISTHVSSAMENLSVKGERKDTAASTRRSSFLMLQIHLKSRLHKNSALTLNSNSLTWQGAWEALKKLASNPECTELIMVTYNSNVMRHRDSFVSLGTPSKVVDHPHRGQLLSSG